VRAAGCLEILPFSRKREKGMNLSDLSRWERLRDHMNSLSLGIGMFL